MSSKQKEVLLVDGRNWCYRNGYTRQSLFSKNRPTGVIYGCLASLIRLHRYFPDAAIVFCWDGISADKSWRHKLAATYKGNRKVPSKDIPQQIKNIRMQIPIVEQLMKDLGFRSFSLPRVEADDLIGVLATALKETFDKVTIYSTDKDFYQLIKENVAVVRDFDKDAHCKEITDKEIKKKFGVTSKHWLHYRSLVGENTDNIAKPIAGVGPAKAIKMLKAGVDPSSDTPHKDYIEHWEKIRLCYRLTKIVRKAHDKRLDEISQEQFRIILQHIRMKDLVRTTRTRTEANYKKFCKFLVDYELAEIFTKRHLIWNIR